eukprot:372692-Pelagomonas_calceolata.AAC.13
MPIAVSALPGHFRSLTSLPTALAELQCPDQWRETSIMPSHLDTHKEKCTVAPEYRLTQALQCTWPSF